MTSLHLVSGIPETVEELHTLVKTCFQLKEDFRLQYMDRDFNEFMNLTSVSEIQNKSTLKVIDLSPVEPYVTLYPVDRSDETSVTTCSEPQPPPPSSGVSSCSDDTLYTSTPHSSPEIRLSGLSSWPTVFVVPKFTYEAELELDQRNTEFEIMEHTSTLAQS